MTSLIRTIIVDDDPRAIEHLEAMLIEYSGIRVIKTETDPGKAVNLILDLNPDVVFLDVQMPGKTGFEIVKELLSNDCKPIIIFVTGFNEFAIQAVRCAALDYLIKPVIAEELKNAIDRFIARKGESTYENQLLKLIEKTVTGKKIKISTTGGFTLIYPDDVLYIKADWNYAEICYDGDKKELVTSNIGSLEELFPANAFFRINRSVIINTTYLSKVSRKKRQAFLVKDGKEYNFKIPLLNIRKLERFLE